MAEKNTGLAGNWDQKVKSKIDGRLTPSQALDRKKCAVFDFDKTLISGDIGEAVFAELILSGRIKKMPGFGHEYIDSSQCLHDLCGHYNFLIGCDKALAYQWLVSIMEGLTVKDVLDATESVCSGDCCFSYYDDASNKMIHCSSPKPFIEMQSLIKICQDLVDIEVRVISSSNVISVRYVAELWFGIKPQNVFGVAPEISPAFNPSLVFDSQDEYNFSKVADYKLSGRLSKPVPIYEGKVEFFKGIRDFVLVAGDSSNDVPMMVEPNGEEYKCLRLWIDYQGEDTKTLKRSMRGYECSEWLFQRADMFTIA